MKTMWMGEPVKFPMAPSQQWRVDFVATANGAAMPASYVIKAASEVEAKRRVMTVIRESWSQHPASADFSFEELTFNFIAVRPIPYTVLAVEQVAPS